MYSGRVKLGVLYSGKSKKRPFEEDSVYIRVISQMTDSRLGGYVSPIDSV